MVSEQNSQKNEAEQFQKKLTVLNSVTPLSKYLAMILFIIMPFLGGWIGYTYSPTKIIEIETIAPEKTEPYADEGAFENENSNSSIGAESPTSTIQTQEKQQQSQNNGRIGTSYCNTTPLDGIEEVGYYNNLHLVMTPEGKEVWALAMVDQVNEFINKTKDCPRIDTIKDILKYPSPESGLTLAFENCRFSDSNASDHDSYIISLVNEEEYTKTSGGQLPVPIKPILAWGGRYSEPSFEEISVSNLQCFTVESDPY